VNPLANPLSKESNMMAKPVEVLLPSLATFQEDLAIALSEVNPEKLLRLYGTQTLIHFLQLEETRFMQIALDMKKADPSLQDWQIEGTALLELMPQEDPESPVEEELTSSMSPSPLLNSSKISEILEFVRNSD
jgi:hypothetical protein